MIAISIRRSHEATFCLTLAGILAALAAVVALAPSVPRQGGLLFVFDGFALFYSGLVLAAAFLTAVLSYDYLKERSRTPEEFYLLLLGALLGALPLIASRHFVSFFLGLETLSISLYPLIAYLRAKRRHTEAALKYLIVSGASSAFLLFGMAIIYGLTGTMEFGLVGQRMSGLADGGAGAMAGMAFIIIGVGFKLGVVPFHMWTPDVYEGAPAPVTAFIATVSKGAVFALVLRYFTDVSLLDHPALLFVFSVIAIASMAAGNLLALFQHNVKRLLAYSSIAHFGYLLVAFMAAGPWRATAVTYYLAAYFAATLGAFGTVALLSPKERDADTMEDYEGLFRRRPWLAGTFTLMLLSLAGMPLTAGFVAKAYLVAAAIGTALWLSVIVLVVTSGIGLFYYLRVIAAMYRSPRPALAPVPARTIGGGAVMCLLFIVLIWWGIYPAPLLALIQRLAISP